MKRILSVCLWSFIISSALADDYSQLYQAAGWSTQVNHFHQLVQATQQQYKENVPTMLYQTILTVSNERFNPTAMKQRGEKTLRDQLADPSSALTFFNSEIGKKVILAETRATSKTSIQSNKHGIPLITISADRKALFARLIKAIPYEQGAVDASVALTNLAADSLETMMPGMGLGETVSQFVIPKQQIEQQVHTQLDNTLAYVYRDLSDDDLQVFLQFAESPAGQTYYQTALKVVDDSLNTK